MKFAEFKHKLCLIPVFLSACRLMGGTFTVVHAFTTSEGTGPLGDLLLSGNTLYGTTSGGGSGGSGSVFKIRTDGTGFQILHNFTEVTLGTNRDVFGTNNDGAVPYGGLLLSGGNLYGTASRGGPFGGGIVFKLDTNGTSFTVLHAFSAQLSQPRGNLVLAGGTLYGTTEGGGSFGLGSVFALDISGGAFATLHDFSALGAFRGLGAFTNADGAYPQGSLCLLNNTLYGTAVEGTPTSYGTVFALKTDGTGFTNLHNFTGSDGVGPYAGLALAGNMFYGTTWEGGTSGQGTVFRINPSGTIFAVLHSFTTNSLGTFVAGANPRGNLICSGTTLYGTAPDRGPLGGGTVFSLNIDGTEFTTLQPFAGTSLSVATNGTGSGPAGLAVAGNTLYGTTSGGGPSGSGTLFSILFTPELTIASVKNGSVLAWPTNYAGFDYAGYTLQTTPNLTPQAVWTPVSPGPVVSAGQYVFTNLTSSAQQFFRLVR